MINILLDGYNIDEPWISETLEKYIKPSHKVTIVAFAFSDDDVKNANDWQSFYGKQNSKYYERFAAPLRHYGILDENITVINYFEDTKETAKAKIEDADILYFTGGLPNRMMERIDEFELRDAILQHKGIIMGYSAGALIQLSEYHISPDEDYPAFCYHNGLGFINNFYLEVHFDDSDIQKASIERVIKERNKTVYAMNSWAGAIIVDSGKMSLIGKVSRFVDTKSNQTLKGMT